MPAEHSPKMWRRRIWILLSYGIAAACLYWVFHDIPFREVLAITARIDWWWLAPAVVLDLLVYVFAAWEWQILLKPVGPVSLPRSMQAVFAGRFANDVLPVHAGYIIRLYLVSRWTRSKIAAILPSLLIERFFDGFWLVVSIGIILLFFPLPPKLVHTGEILGGIIACGAVAIFWLSFRKKSAAQKCVSLLCRWRPARKLRDFTRTLLQGVRHIGRSWLLPAALGLSVLKLVLTALAFLALVHAYGLHLSLPVSLASFLIAYAGLSLPSTPASLGVFQLFCAAGLTFFGVPKPVASAFALMAFVVLTVPLSIGGFIAFAQSGLTWRQLRGEVRHWKRPRIPAESVKAQT